MSCLQQLCLQPGPIHRAQLGHLLGYPGLQSQPQEHWHFILPLVNIRSGWPCCPGAAGASLNRVVITYPDPISQTLGGRVVYETLLTATFPRQPKRFSHI